jgi:DNA-binding MarR family transcriptional regulator
MHERSSDEGLKQFRQEHIGRLLAELHRDFSARIRQQIAEAGHRDVTQAHLKLLRSLPLEGARLTELAQRLGITPQSAGARVDELVACGYLERKADPSDGRATVIRFSSRGRRMLAQAPGLVADIERLYAERLGSARFDAMKASLAALIEALEITLPV